MRDQPVGVHFQGVTPFNAKPAGNRRVIGRSFRKLYTYIYIYIERERERERESQTSVQTQLHDVTKAGRDVSFAWNEHRKEECDRGGGAGWQTNR